MRECGEIMGVTGELSEESPASSGPMGILDHVFKKLIRFKMLNQVRSGVPENTEVHVQYYSGSLFNANLARFVLLEVLELRVTRSS